MRKKSETSKKFIYEQQNTQKNSISQEFGEQLRCAIEDLQTYKLSSELQTQKRILIQQQYRSMKQQNEQLKAQNGKIRKQNNKFVKKYQKLKNKFHQLSNNCAYQSQIQQLSAQLERQRQIYYNDRNILRKQIHQLQQQINQDQQDKNKGNHYKKINNTDFIEAEIRIHEQQQLIQFMNHQLSSFEIENIHILQAISKTQQLLQNLQIQNMSLKKQLINNQRYQMKEGSSGRKTGSIKNIHHMKQFNQDL